MARYLVQTAPTDQLFAVEIDIEALSQQKLQVQLTDSRNARNHHHTAKQVMRLVAGVIDLKLCVDLRFHGLKLALCHVEHCDQVHIM